MTSAIAEIILIDDAECRARFVGERQVLGANHGRLECTRSIQIILVELRSADHEAVSVELGEGGCESSQRRIAVRLPVFIRSSPPRDRHPCRKSGGEVRGELHAIIGLPRVTREALTMLHL